MRKLSISILSALVIIVPSAAFAADMPKAPPMMTAAPAFSWAGMYVGANGGYGSSSNCWDLIDPVFGVFAEGCPRATGGVAGGQIGYRWQMSAWVFGVEAQGNWADLSGRRVSSVNLALTNESRINAFGLFTGQLGYAWNNVLIYVKGGAAVTQNEHASFDTPTNIQLTSTVDDNRWGGAVGVGLEYGFMPNWSVAVAYDHLFMDTKLDTFLHNGIAGARGTIAFTDRIKQDVDLITVRVNYGFGGPVYGRY